MSTRKEIVEQIRKEVTVMANPARSHTNAGNAVELENGNWLETHLVPVWVMTRDGVLKPTKRAIAVQYDGAPDDADRQEVAAWPVEPKQVDYVAPPAVAEAESVLEQGRNELLAMISRGDAVAEFGGRTISQYRAIDVKMIEDDATHKKMTVVKLELTLGDGTEVPVWVTRGKNKKLQFDLA